MNDFFSFRKDPQGNYLVYYETQPLGVVFTVKQDVWCADIIRNNEWNRNVPEDLRGMIIGFISKEYAAFYMYRTWLAFK